MPLPLLLLLLLLLTRQANSWAGQPFREHPQKLAMRAASFHAPPQMVPAACSLAHSPQYLAGDLPHRNLVLLAALALQLLLRCLVSRRLQLSTDRRQDVMLRVVAVAMAVVIRRAVMVTAITSRASRSCSCLMDSLLETDVAV
jgi:hypothetical protein